MALIQKNVMMVAIRQGLGAYICTNIARDTVFEILGSHGTVGSDIGVKENEKCFKDCFFEVMGEVMDCLLKGLR